jgi:hypothetical protein
MTLFYAPEWPQHSFFSLIRVFPLQQRSRTLAFATEILGDAVCNHDSVRDGISLGIH